MLQGFARLWKLFARAMSGGGSRPSKRCEGCAEGTF